MNKLLLVILILNHTFRIFFKLTNDFYLKLVERVEKEIPYFFLSRLVNREDFIFSN